MTPVAEDAASSEVVELACQPVPECLGREVGRLTVRLYVELEGHPVLVDLAQSGDLRTLNLALSVLATVRDQLVSPGVGSPTAGDGASPSVIRAG